MQTLSIHIIIKIYYFTLHLKAVSILHLLPIILNYMLSFVTLQEQPNHNLDLQRVF